MLVLLQVAQELWGSIDRLGMLPGECFEVGHGMGMNVQMGRELDMQMGMERGCCWASVWKMDMDMVISMDIRNTAGCRCIDDGKGTMI